MNYLVDGFKNYVNFDGRATRKQFWFWTLWVYSLIIITTFIDVLIGTDGAFEDSGLLSTIFSLAILLPNLAIMIRRLHDIGKTGFWVLINIVPVIGFIYLVVLLCRRSDPGLNQYGPPANMVIEDSIELKYERVGKELEDKIL